MMSLSEVRIGYRFVRMGHSHSHHNHEEEELRQLREFMNGDHREVLARVEVAVAQIASPVWRVLAALGIRR